MPSVNVSDETFSAVKQYADRKGIRVGEAATFFLASTIKRRVTIQKFNSNKVKAKKKVAKPAK